MHIDSRESLGGDKRKPDTSLFLEAVERLSVSEIKLSELHMERANALREIRFYFMQKESDLNV